MQKVKLNNGLEMPILGYGVYLVDPKECERCVTDAIEEGYRLIDTAQAYFNEEGVGEAVSKSGIKREEFFLVSKVWITNGGYEKAKVSIDESLKKLKTDYLDLMLIHQPFNDYYGTYRAMEEAYKEGKLKAIGLSNFFPDRFTDISNFAEVQPAINQMEVHIFQQQANFRELLKKYNTQLMAWSPMARGENNLFENEVLKRIGNKYGKTPAQVSLRFLIQENVIVIPKSTHKDRMKENFEVFDFQLSDADMTELKKLDKGASVFLNHYDPSSVEMLINYGK
ncbi:MULTISPECIES: aldo/keto reductase [Brachyspira]|uniref:aldo/keto reductase n=1 Tax=Brachyspira TaxID=29521 RepID=UPI0030077F1F